MAISVREVDLDRELPLLASVFNANFRLKGDDARFRWLYLNNPDGRATAWFVLDDRSGEVVGCTSVFPRRMRVRGSGRTVVAWNCGDFCITPRYRTLGAAITLRRAARDAVERGVCPFLYAHPNDRMLQIHLKVGHQPLGRMVRYAKLLRPHTGWRLADALGAGVLRGAGLDIFVRSRHEAELGDDAALGDELSELYEAVAPRLGTSLVRDAIYLRWRFGQNPSAGDRIILSRLGGRLTGYLVFAIDQSGALIKDWLARDAEAWNRLFAACLEELRRQAARSVSVIVLETHPDIARLQRFGFVRRPGASTAVTYARSTYARRSDVTTPEAWYMTVGDRDI
jgi:hypothetical protein